jgi:ABC-type multidrug transport system permease subunit
MDFCVKIFPTIMIILSILSALMYTIRDIADWRHILYYLFAAGITFCITY